MNIDVDYFSMCINGTFRCNKLNNCIPKCSQQEFTCNSTGDCIPLQWVCDKTQDCDDDSDEANCSMSFLIIVLPIDFLIVMYIECATDDFICGNGQCIQPSYRCDGLPQCRDGSDELNCNYTVPCTQFQCDNKQCIPNSWVCDGVIDCSSDGEDRSDEHHCNTTKCDTDSGREFHCNNMPSGKCLSIAQLCDGHDDCGDGSDEKNCNCTCSQSAFSCKTICQCIPVSEVCDGTKQCKDGSDEQNCKCNQGEYTCKGGLCINATKLCDGIVDCPKSDDETYPACSK
jgi:integrin beta 2